MALARRYQPQGGHFCSDGKSSYGRNSRAAASYNWNYDSHPYNSKYCIPNHDLSYDLFGNLMLNGPNHDHVWPDAVPATKRRKLSDTSCQSTWRPYQHQTKYESGIDDHAYLLQRVPPQFVNAYCNAPLGCNKSSAVVAPTTPDDTGAYVSTTSKRDRSKFEDAEEVVFMSRDEIERCSPSRKDGIDALHETHLRYSYCAFLQNLGVQLDLPQTTIGTAMVLCHRFFLRRSHASHDRFLIATAALFLVSKSEETARPLNDVLRASCEMLHKQDFDVLSYMLPIDWFEQYREQIIGAEQLILTTLNFELSVQHPYESLTSTLQKLGFSQSVLVNLALSLVSEGLFHMECYKQAEEFVKALAGYFFVSDHADCLPIFLQLIQIYSLRKVLRPAVYPKLRTSLWLQFKPHQIAAGAAYLAAKILNMNLHSCHKVWHEFQTPPYVLRDVAHQLMELF